jgi:eukaryotic-like serine/threonine-protein kinase
MAFDSMSEDTIDEEARRRFEAAWRAGVPQPIERFLPAEEETQFLPTLEELVAIELEFRWKVFSAPDEESLRDYPRVEEYLVRFPTLNQPDILDRLFREQSRLRGRHEIRHASDSKFLTLSDNSKTRVDHVLTAIGRSAPFPNLPGYEILEEIARGGMGIVYKARQVRLNRFAAIKMIVAGAQASPIARARFQAEAQVVAGLRHPNIVQIFEIGEHARLPYLSLEFIDGGTLGDKTIRLPQPPRLAAKWVEVLARAVHYAHCCGIVHRDLKPANVLVTTDGTLKLTDFGLARRWEEDSNQTKTGEILGTAAYMAPEQGRPSPGTIGPPADIYALGAILYELLTGRPPFQGESAWEILLQAQSAEPVPPRKYLLKTPIDLETICLKCLEKDPLRRYSSAAALADDLGSFLAHRTIQARPAGMLERLWRWSLRHPSRAAAALFVAGDLVAIVVLSIWFALYQGHVATTSRKEQLQTKAAEANARKLLHDLQATDRQRVRLSRLSARLVLEQGHARCEQGDVAVGMLMMAHGLTIAPSDAPELSNAVRLDLGTWRGQVRPLRAILSHEGAVRHVTFSPDGRTVLTAADDRTARLWETRTGLPIGAVMRHRDIVRCGVFSPDGAKLFTGSKDQTGRLWDAATGQPIGEPLPHASFVFAAAFSPDGRRLATGGYDCRVSLWDVATGALIGRPMLLPYAGTVRAIVFSPDGRTILSSGDDGTARMWDAATCAPKGAIMRHSAWVRAASFSPDGKTVLTASHDHSARLWDAETGQPRNAAPMLHDDAVNAAVFSPDGRFVLTGSGDNTARLWNAETGHPIGIPMLHLDHVEAVAFSPDGKIVLTGGKDGDARLWDARTGEPLGAALKHQHQIRSVAISPDGKTALTGSQDKTARLWDLTGCGPTPRIPPQRDAVMTAAFRPDDRVLATGDWGGNARLWDAESLRSLGESLVHASRIYSAEFSPDGETLLTGSWDNTARLWDARTGAARAPVFDHGAPVFAARFSPDGRHVVTVGQDAQIRLWNVATGQLSLPPMSHAEKKAVWWVTFSPDGRLLATTGYDCTARLWEVTTGKLLRTLVHPEPTWGVAFSPDGKTLLTGCWDRKARLWDVQTGAPHPVTFPHRDWVMGVAFSPDGRSVLTGSKDATARLWDSALGQPLGPVMNHDKQVLSVLFSHDGKKLLTTSEDRSASLWRAPTLVSGTAERIKLWVEVITGMELDEDGIVRGLSAQEWERRRQELRELGGPPDG